MKNKSNNNLIYSSLLIIECMIWGAGNPITKIGLESVSPFYCLAIRFSIAFIILAIFAGKNAILSLSKEDLKSLFVISGFTAVAFIMSTLCLLYTEATIAGFLMALAVIFTPFFSYYLLGTKPNKTMFAIIAMVVVGMYFLCGNSGSFQFGIGEILAILSSVFLAAALTYTSKHVNKVGPMVLSMSQAGCTAIISIAFALVLEDYHIIPSITYEGWGAIIYLAIFCTCIAYILQNIALKKVSPIFASVAFCTEPIFTAIASYFILGEVLSLSGFIGSALITISLVFAALFVNNNKSIDGSKANEDDTVQTEEVII